MFYDIFMNIPLVNIMLDATGHKEASTTCTSKKNPKRLTFFKDKVATFQNNPRATAEHYTIIHCIKKLSAKYKFYQSITGIVFPWLYDGLTYSSIGLDPCVGLLKRVTARYSRSWKEHWELEKPQTTEVKSLLNRIPNGTGNIQGPSQCQVKVKVKKRCRSFEVQGHQQGSWVTQGSGYTRSRSE